MAQFRTMILDGGCQLSIARGIDVDYRGKQFEQLWDLHPAERGRVRIAGIWRRTPRWQEAYGHDYPFAGQVAEARPMVDMLETALAWGRRHVDLRLNGLLLNWYAGHEHYIGSHHDDTRTIVAGSSIVTLSYGEPRIFRLTREERIDGRRKLVARHDVMATHASAIVIPWATNLVWKHAVPRRAAYRGRRVSITMRAFEQAGCSGL